MRKTVAFAMLFLSSAACAQTAADRILWEGFSGAVVGGFLGLVAGIIWAIGILLKKARKAAAPRAAQVKKSATETIKGIAEGGRRAVNNVTTSQEDRVLSIDDKYFEAAADEISQNVQKRGLWLKALTLADGDETRQNAIYIRLRAKQLSETKRAEGKESSDMQQPLGVKESVKETEAPRTSVEMVAKEECEENLISRESEYVRSLERLANALTKVKIYASRETDGTWRVHLPDGTLWIADDDSAFHDHAKRALGEEILSRPNDWRFEKKSDEPA